MNSPILKAGNVFFFPNSPYLQTTITGIMQTRQASINPPLKPIESSTTKELPFFCALECRVRKHTNLWIKVRTGNDESYLKMIKPSN